jgi:hypothetical protein
MLVSRAVFIAVLHETQERAAMETTPRDKSAFDLGVYTQGVNCLMGLLRCLGLEKRVKAAGGLKHYMQEQAEGEETY